MRLKQLNAAIFKEFLIMTTGKEKSDLSDLTDSNFCNEIKGKGDGKKLELH